jgi:amino acid adenylation domain-containing protein
MKTLNHLSADLFKSISEHSGSNAFFISGSYYTYKEFAAMCGKYIRCIRENNYRVVSVYTTNHIETYASIIAVFISGKTFMPVHPDNPADRSLFTLKASGADVIFTVDALPFSLPCPVQHATSVAGMASDFSLNENLSDDTAYILFTSGSTGTPKGVPISYHNIGSFLNGFFHEGIELTPDDRVLQMFHLTFDLSLCSYLTGLLHGACIYTLPPVEVKYMAVYEMLEEHRITFSIMVPSIISYLRPFFSEIKLDALRYNIFCGEALYLDIIEEWRNCIPNARIFNVYGPTEDIICTSYEVPANHCKSMNGIICIGKAMKDNIVEIFGEDGKLTGSNAKGELCLAGPHLTKGYITEPEKNDRAFFEYEIEGIRHRFYHSGDIGIRDHNGDLFYLGRNDNQVKVSGGYRVELSEIEFHAMTAAPDVRLVALAQPKASGVCVIHIVTEGNEEKTEKIRTHLKKTLPEYMHPDDYHSIPAFPLSANGKIDRRKITSVVFG